LDAGIEINHIYARSWRHPGMWRHESCARKQDNNNSSHCTCTFVLTCQPCSSLDAAVGQWGGVDSPHRTSGQFRLAFSACLGSTGTWYSRWSFWSSVCPRVVRWSLGVCGL